MLGSVRAQGMEVTASAEDADVLIVNTCAFIDSAKEESIEAIFQAHESRGLRRRPGQKIIVSGCMAQRFSTELSHEMREVDAFMGSGPGRAGGRDRPRASSNAPARAAAAVPMFRGPLARESETSKRWSRSTSSRAVRATSPIGTRRAFRLTPAHTAYVKIAEGCNHPCSFCVIPQMRGRHRSRTIESVAREVRALVAEGVKEICLISQDTTYFGMDLWQQKAGPRQPVDSQRGPTLSRLLDELGAIEGDFWVRLLYTHPAHWSDELIAAIARNERVARYVDMPLQHIHPDDARPHAPRNVPRAHRGPHRAPARGASRGWRCGRRSSRVSPARRTNISRACWSSSSGCGSSGWGCSAIRRRKVRARRRWTGRSPTPSSAAATPEGDEAPAARGQGSFRPAGGAGGCGC